MVLCPRRSFLSRRRVRSGILSLSAAVLIASASVAPAFASRVRILSLEEMTQHAARVFSGRCVQVRVHRDPTLERTVTLVTFEVDRAVKGAGPKRLTVKLLGDQRAVKEKGRGIEGVPRFLEGEEVILFLYGDSRSGLTSPVGFGQGKFTVVNDKQGRKVALNGLGNETLFRGLSSEAKGKLGDHADRWKGGDGIPLEALLEMVTRLQE